MWHYNNAFCLCSLRLVSFNHERYRWAPSLRIIRSVPIEHLFHCRKSKKKTYTKKLFIVMDIDVSFGSFRMARAFLLFRKCDLTESRRKSPRGVGSAVTTKFKFSYCYCCLLVFNGSRVEAGRLLYRHETLTSVDRWFWSRVVSPPIGCNIIINIITARPARSAAMPVLFLFNSPKIGPPKKGPLPVPNFTFIGAEMWEYNPQNCQNFEVWP